MDEVKNKIKASAKRLGRRVLIIFLPVFSIITFLAVSVYYITVWADGKGDDDWSGTPYAAGQYTSNITMSSDGKLTSQMTAEELWNKMIENGSRVDLYLDGPEELLKLMNAELVTNFVNIEPNIKIDWDKINNIKSKDIQGIIKLKRAKSNGGTDTLTYVDEDTFNSYITKYNETGSGSAKNNAMSHFTLGSAMDHNGEMTYYAIVATWNETRETITTNDPEVQEKDNTIHYMSTTNINYQEYVKGYTMPFDYLWQLLVVGEDKDFVLELADLVYDSEIEITIFDNYTEAKTSYKETREVQTRKNPRKLTTTYTTTSKMNNLEIALTLADVWIVKYTQEFEFEKDGENAKYVLFPPDIKEKIDKNSDEDNFVTLFLKKSNSKAKNNILSVDEWLFELIEENESTVDMLDLTKYLLYKATGTDYGVTEFDFDATYRVKLSSVGAGDYVVHIEKSSENIVITDLEILKNAFSGYSGSSKLIEHAQEFLDLQEKYKVNAVFAAAVSISETSAGRAGNATNGKNNWFNIECTCGNSSHGRFETYESAKKSIERFYWQIAKGNYYFTEGNYTVTNIGMIYCEDADAPGGWIENTNAFMTQMFQAAGIDTSSYFGTEGGITTEEERVELENYIQNELIHTRYHLKNYQYQNGPFAKWWSSPYTALSKFQCTWWAFGRASMYLEQYGTKYDKYPTQMGHGGQYYSKNVQRWMVQIWKHT